MDVLSWLFPVFNVILFLGLAPLYEGVLRRLAARVQSRRGPPLIQPYYDLFKLLGKERIDSAGTWPFRPQGSTWQTPKAHCSKASRNELPLGAGGSPPH